VTVQGITEKFGTVDAETVGPVLNLGCFLLVHPKAQHCHTDRIPRMTRVGAYPITPLVDDGGRSTEGANSWAWISVLRLRSGCATSNT